jgi:hypothetical protein
MFSVPSAEPSTSCVECPYGKYQQQLGQTSCIANITKATFKVDFKLYDREQAEAVEMAGWRPITSKELERGYKRLLMWQYLEHSTLGVIGAWTAKTGCVTVNGDLAGEVRVLVASAADATPQAVTAIDFGMGRVTSSFVDDASYSLGFVTGPVGSYIFSDLSTASFLSAQQVDSRGICSPEDLQGGQAPQVYVQKVLVHAVDPNRTECTVVGGERLCVTVTPSPPLAECAWGRWSR